MVPVGKGGDCIKAISMCCLKIMLFLIKLVTLRENLRESYPERILRRIAFGWSD